MSAHISQPEGQSQPQSAAAGTTPLETPTPVEMPAIGQLAEAVRDPEAAGRISRAPEAKKRFPWWAPSMSDLFIVAFFVWTFLSSPVGFSVLLADADSGWHIRTGEVILATHAVPQKDLFSYSKPNENWYAWEWLTDVLWAQLHTSFGLRGVTWFAAILIGSFVALLFRFSLWMGASLFITMMVTLLGTGGASIHFLARPHLFTLALLPLAVWLIEADRRRPSLRVCLVIPLVALWTSLHGGFPAVLLVLGALSAGSAIEVLIGAEGASWSQPIRYGILTFCSSLATLANPYGLQLHEHMLAYLRSDWIRNTIEEFHSPDFRSETTMQFELLLFAGLLVAASMMSRKRITEALWILGFGHMALQSLRHIPVFVAVTAPFIALELTRWWNQAFGSAAKKSLAGIWNQMNADLKPSFNRTTAWLPLAFFGALLLPASVAHWPTDYPVQMFPVELIHKRQQMLAHSRLLTTDQWADYLIYLNYPVQRDFVDGRSDFFGPELGNQYLQMLQGQYQWKSLIDKWGFDHVLAPLDWPLASLLKTDANWRILDDTGKAILFERVRPVAR